MKFVAGFNIGMSICLFMAFNYLLNNHGYDFLTYSIGIVGCICLGVGFVSCVTDEV